MSPRNDYRRETYSIWDHASAQDDFPESRRMSWRGTPICKFPTDLYLYAEAIHDTQPTLIVETGSWMGGSARFFRDVSDADVLSIGIDEGVTPQDQPGITFLHGSSTSAEILQEVAARVRGQRVMVVLDSDHSYEHVREELRFYPTHFVTPGCYLVIEDTYQLDGPRLATQEFLEANPSWQHDITKDRFLATLNTGAWLRQV